MTNTIQSCNACDTVDYDGELDDAGRCAQCVAEEREFVAHHNGGHTTAQCEQGQHDFQFPVDSYGVPMTTARYCSNCDTIESGPIMSTMTTTYRQIRGTLTDNERIAIRALCATGRYLRANIRPDADIVDAMVRLDVQIKTNYAAQVALRAYHNATKASQS